MSSITYSTDYPTPVVRTRLRLTRRGRAVIAILVSLPLVIALVMLALNGGGATATSGAVAPTTVTVQAGESLWSLAGVLAPEASPADVVSDILAINGLDSASVQPGQVLIVPERYAD
jgi:nucleoid-associated protein YgaU